MTPRLSPANAMEPPAKRMRMSPSDEMENLVAQSGTITNDIQASSEIVPVNEEPIVGSNSRPTTTTNAPDIRNRNLQQRGIRSQRSAGMHLAPRAPEVTITANMVNIAILDGPDQTSYTQIIAPPTDIELPIAKVGTVKIAGLAQPTGNPTFVASSATSNSLSAGNSGAATTSSFPSTSVPVNGTTSAERTVTVTATSLLRVSIRNTTVTLISPSHHRTIFTADGFTTTIDEAPNNAETHSGRFGDMYTSSPLVGHPTDSHIQPNEAAATSSSQIEATPTNTPPGGTIVLTPQQQQMVGGVVGGVAGVALVLLGILYILKWYRHRLKVQGRLPEQMRGHRSLPSGDDREYIAPSAMTQPSEAALVPITAFKQTLQKLRPHSAYTLTSTHTGRSSTAAADSERSFQRVSGRKIPSVLLTGGDGYGNPGPVSQISGHALSQSQEISQSSFYHESENTANPFAVPADAESISEHGTPPRRHISPFLDPSPEAQTHAPSPVAGMSAITRNFAASNRSQLSIQTGGLTAWNPNRQNEINVTMRPSPARTPTTSSPTSSSLRLPMHTPPLMSGDIPEMPPLQPWRHNMAPRKFSDDGASLQRSTRSMGQRTMSAVSVRSSTSVGGKFKEDI